MARWFSDYDTVLDFAKVLNLAKEFNKVSDLLYFFDNPHEWDEEYKAWVEVAKPTEEDAEGWEEFVGYLDEREEPEA